MVNADFPTTGGPTTTRRNSSTDCCYMHMLVILVSTKEAIDSRHSSLSNRNIHSFRKLPIEIRKQIKNKEKIKELKLEVKMENFFATDSFFLHRKKRKQ